MHNKYAATASSALAVKRAQSPLHNNNQKGAAERYLQWREQVAAGSTVHGETEVGEPSESTGNRPAQRRGERAGWRFYADSSAARSRCHVAFNEWPEDGTERGVDCRRRWIGAWHVEAGDVAGSTFICEGQRPVRRRGKRRAWRARCREGRAAASSFWQ